MSGNAVLSISQHVSRLATASLSDEQLLADFIARRSDEAFAALIATSKCPGAVGNLPKARTDPGRHPR